MGMPRNDGAKKWREWLIGGVLVGGTVLLFSRSLGYGFINYDDPQYVTDNPAVQSGLSGAGLAWALSASVFSWHPLTWLSHMLDWQLYGDQAAGHHLTSVLLHAANAVLVWLLMRRLGAGTWWSAFAAAVFAWHPLRVESVTWISERKDVLSGCFFLLAIIAYTVFVERRAQGRRASPAYGALLACFVAGLMSKPMVVTLPVVLLLLEAWPLRRLGSPATLRPVLLEKAPLFLLSIVDAVATVLTQQNSGAFMLDLPFAARAGNALVALPRYLAKVVWPGDLIVCYAHPGHWPWPAVAGAGLFTLAATVYAWRERGRWPWLIIGWAWFLVVLLPTLGLLQVGFQSMADRYTYLPVLGIGMAVAWGGAAWVGDRRGRRLAALGAGGAILAGCVGCTWHQQSVWRDSVALFQHAVDVSPNNAVAHGFLASALFAQGRVEDAAAHAERAIALDPRATTARLTLADVRERQGRTDEAEALVQAVAALRPDDLNVRCQLGLLELSLGRPDEARALMVPALEASEALRQRTLELAARALQHGDRYVAQFHYEAVLAADPASAEAHAGLGVLELSRHDPWAALAHVREAARLRPDLADFQLVLARCAEEAGSLPEARSALDRALANAPESADICATAAEFHARQHEFGRAVQLYQEAVALAPSDARMHAALGSILMETGDRAGANASWRRALELDPGFPGLRDRLERTE